MSDQNRNQLEMLRDAAIQHTVNLEAVYAAANNRGQAILASAALIEAQSLVRSLDILLG